MMMIEIAIYYHQWEFGHSMNDRGWYTTVDLSPRHRITFYPTPETQHKIFMYPTSDIVSRYNLRLDPQYPVPGIVSRDSTVEARPWKRDLAFEKRSDFVSTSY